MDSVLASDFMARLQQAQDALAIKTGLSLVLVDSQGREITIPSHLPLVCAQESHANRCLSDFRQLIKKARSQEEAVIQKCFGGLFVLGFKTAFRIDQGEVFLIGGRTDDLSSIQNGLNLISAIYSLPVATAGIAGDRDGRPEERALVTGVLSVLTIQEIRILRLIGEGFSNKAIAAQLYISPNTVKAHVSRILQKLQLSNRTDAALFALENGLVRRDQIVQK